MALKKQTNSTNISASIHYISNCLSVSGSQWQHSKQSSQPSFFTAHSSNSYCGNPKCAVPGAPPKGGIQGNPTSCLSHFSFWLLFLWRSNSSIPRPSWLVKVLTSLRTLGPATLRRNMSSIFSHNVFTEVSNLQCWLRWDSGSEKDSPVNHEHCSVAFRPQPVT